ncbi:hypothetical protein CDL60_13975 [Roseateles noduli]|nr:hypothetical protein CDL60_13975 [Roseateles noduli]
MICWRLTVAQEAGGATLAEFRYGHSYFSCGDAMASGLDAPARRFDRRIEREDVGPECDAVDLPGSFLS